MTIGVTATLDLVKKAKSDTALLSAIQAEALKLSDTPEDNAALEAALSAKANSEIQHRLLVENDGSTSIDYGFVDDNKSYPNSTIIIDNKFGLDGQFGFTPIPNFNKAPTDDFEIVPGSTNPSEVKSSVIPNVESAVLGELEAIRNAKLANFKRDAQFSPDNAFGYVIGSAAAKNNVRVKNIKIAKLQEATFKAAQVLNKFPQVVDDVTHVIKQITGFDATQYITIPLNAKVESATGIKDASSCIAPTIQVASAGVMSANFHIVTTNIYQDDLTSLYLVVNAVLKTETGYSYAQDYLVKPLANLLQPYVGNNAEYYINTGTQLVGTTALGFAFGGPVLGLATLGFQAANLGLDYGTQHGYISAENPLINYGLKPGLAVGSQIMSIVYSPNKIVKAFEIVHLVREGFDHTQAYLDSFKFTDDQFPVLKGLGISATDLMAEIQATATDDDLVRESYNAKITKIFNDHFAVKAKETHCKGEAISAELAKDASSVRNELKYLHHLQTSLVGRIATYKLEYKYKDGTTINLDYASFHAQGKSDESIFYASFKTDGGKLGLKNNGFAEAITLAAQLTKAAVAGVKEIYPGHIKDGAAECFAQNSNDITKAFETTCKDYFDFTCPVLQTV